VSAKPNLLARLTSPDVLMSVLAFVLINPFGHVPESTEQRSVARIWCIVNSTRIASTITIQPWCRQGALPYQRRAFSSLASTTANEARVLPRGSNHDVETQAPMSFRQTPINGQSY
jgi:hypothetical protein